MERLIDFLSGALMLAYLLAGVYFLRFWKKTRDRLFFHFAIAFWLFALNQLASFESATGEATGFPYVLRVAGFLIILAAIVGKNTGRYK
ncbi:MAG TPA: DUF5985 family protein [Chthoniobacteraceae bacterium]|nr:DUF5985 family protein [Chthoniobacteraceae bacterium]